MTDDPMVDTPESVSETELLATAAAQCIKQKTRIEELEQQNAAYLGELSDYAKTVERLRTALTESAAEIDLQKLRRHELSGEVERLRLTVKHSDIGKFEYHDPARCNKDLIAELADIKAAYARALESPCPDERHCTCVPALRSKLAEVQENWIDPGRWLDAVERFRVVREERDKRGFEVERLKGELAALRSRCEQSS